MSPSRHDSAATSTSATPGDPAVAAVAAVPASPKKPMIANARMYAIDPESARAWNRLLQWVLDRARLPIDVIDYPAPRPLSALWARDDLGAVFMCGLPYSLALDTRSCDTRRPPQIVAAPVPSPARYRNRPHYMTDVVVRRDAHYARIEDTFGRVAGYTVPDSQSGYFAFRYFLAPYQRPGIRPLYRSVVGGLVNARGVIQALADGRIDVGPLDSYCHDLLKRNDPAFARQVRTIASTEPTPVPVVVASGEMPDDHLSRLRDAFGEVGSAPDLAALRDTLLLSRFALPDADAYAMLRERHSALMAAPEVW